MIKDITGYVFGRLTVVERRGSDRGRRALWLCRCDCGQERVVSGDSLRRGGTQSCGCLQRERTARSNTKHGMHDSPEFACWSSMLTRCQNKNSDRYADYGGRGIAVCERWQSFESFFADMGPRPSSTHSIERDSNDSDYEPNNCRWATPKEQARNKRSTRFVELGGETISLAEACERTGVKYGTAWDRLRRGWPVGRALSPNPEQGIVLTDPGDLLRGYEQAA